jgi:mRNA-degrading endonuclease RelE of RelBE toxin-antitoxin system
MKYAIELSSAAESNLDDLPAYDRKIIVDAMAKHLTHQPTKPTRNRKQLRPNPMATWELRVGKYRVLYNVIEERVIVVIVAVAVKKGNRFTIGGEEHEL